MKEIFRNVLEVRLFETILSSYVIQREYHKDYMTKFV